MDLTFRVVDQALIDSTYRHVHITGHRCNGTLGDLKISYSIALMFQLIDTSLYSHEDFHVNLQISDSIILTFRMVDQEWLR